MSEPEPMFDIPIDQFNAMTAAYTILMNEMRAHNYDLGAVIAAGMFALGSATAQSGGVIPETLLLKDLQPFADGYRCGLDVMRRRAQ